MSVMWILDTSESEPLLSMLKCLIDMLPSLPSASALMEMGEWAEASWGISALKSDGTRSNEACEFQLVLLMKFLMSFLLIESGHVASKFGRDMVLCGSFTVNPCRCPPVFP